MLSELLLAFDIDPRVGKGKCWSRIRASRSISVMSDEYCRNWLLFTDLDQDRGSKVLVWQLGTGSGLTSTLCNTKATSAWNVVCVKITVWLENLGESSAYQGGEI